MYDLNDFDSNDGFADRFQEASKHTMMEAIYNTLINDQERAIASKTPVEEKLDALKTLFDILKSMKNTKNVLILKKL